MRLSDVVLFNITAIVGLRWLTTAASQFGLASLVLWLVALVVFFLPSAVAVRELADIDPGAGGIYRWVRRAYGPLHGFVAGWGYWVNNLFYFPSLLVATAAIAAYAGGPRFVRLGDDNVSGTARGCPRSSSCCSPRGRSRGTAARRRSRSAGWCLRSSISRRSTCSPP